MGKSRKDYEKYLNSISPDRDDKRKTIKLSLSINDDDNDDVFCYCNGIESFKQLAEYGMVKFIVTGCWNFF